jgi:hypothetical protein
MVTNILGFNGIVFSVIGDVSIAYRSRVCVCMFIGVSVHVSVYVVLCNLKKTIEYIVILWQLLAYNTLNTSGALLCLTS